MRSQTGHAFTVVKRGFLACRGFDVFADYAGIGGSVIWRGVQIELLTQSGVRPSNVNSAVRITCKFCYHNQIE